MVEPYFTYDAMSSHIHFPEPRRYSFPVPAKGSLFPMVSNCGLMSVKILPFFHKNYCFPLLLSLPGPVTF